MKASVYISRLAAITKQRDLLLPLCIVLSLSLFLCILCLFLKKERVILVPPIMSQPVWIDGYAVSPTYLEQMGVFLGQMLLSNSAASLAVQRDMVLRYVHPRVYTHIRQHLIGEEQHLTKHQGSYHFHVTKVSTDMAKNTVTLIGERASYIGDRRLDSAIETYQLKFAFSHGRYLLVECVKESK